MASFMDALFKEDAIEVMIGNLERLNEEKDDDRQGVFHTLSTGPLNMQLTFSDTRKHHVVLSILRQSVPRIAIPLATLKNREKRTAGLPK